MQSPIKVPPSANLNTIGPEEVFSVGPRKSLRKRKAAVLRPQPTSSDSELSPLPEEGPVVAKRPAKKRRKVTTRVEVVENEEFFAAAGGAADLVKTPKRKRKVKAAMAEEETLEYTQESETPKKRTRKPKVVEPVVYNIPDVERKETTFKGKSHPQVT